MSGIYLFGSPQSQTGRAGMNLGGGDINAANVTNIFKMSYVSFNTPSDASKVDADGYLTSTPAGNVGLSWSGAGTTYLGSDYKLTWPATIQFKMVFGSAMTLVGSPVGATVTGGTGVGNTTIVTTSGAGSVVLTMGATNPSGYFANDGTFSHSGGEIAFYRVTDEARFLAGHYWTSEYVTRLSSLNLAYLRPMGWVNSGGNNYNCEVEWRYRIPTTQFSWASQRTIPTAWAGATSGTDTYTCGSYTDMPVSYTDGEVFLCNISNTNTSSTVTLDSGGRGAKTVYTIAATPPATSGTGSQRLNVGPAYFRYDGILDKLLYANGAYVAQIPIEAQIQLANEVGCPLWVVIPVMANDDFVTQISTVLKNTLTGMVYYELSNEVWNNSWPQTGWSRIRGQALGWTSTNNQDTYGWHALRTRQIMGDVIPAVYGGTLRARVRRVMAYQGGGFLFIQQVGRFEGNALNTSIGNALYSTVAGGHNYDTFPNRPVDVCESIAYAPYTGGTNMCLGDDLLGSVGPDNLPFYQALVDAWVGGDSATSIAMIDTDIRTGRILVNNVTASGTTFTTKDGGGSPVAHGFSAGNNIYFDVTGGTAYSGITIRKPYSVLTIPTSSTFTVRAYDAGEPAGSAVNAGSAGSGTMNVGFVERNILYQTYWMPAFAEVAATSYDSQRTGAGMPLLRADQYEGNLEPKGPNATQCGAIGITGHTNAAAAAAISAALDAWRFSSSAKETQKTYFKAATGLDSAYPANTHTITTSHLVLPGPGLFSMLSGPLPTDTPYQTLVGLQEFNQTYPQP